MRGFALTAVLALAGACTGGDIELVEKREDQHDYGRAELLAVVEAHAAKPVSPESFRDFAQRIDALRPRFNEELEDLAELYVSFAALPVMQKLAGEPRDEQLDKLALTVFPTAFGVKPKPDETPREYLLRLCGEAKPLECKDYVPDGWPVVLSAKVRRTIKHRAQEALSSCQKCANEDVYEGMLAEFSDKVADEDAYAALHKGDYLPNKWPLAGAAASEWSGAPVLSIDGDGDATFEGEALPTGGWHGPLRDRRDGRKVLGVHLLPDDRVETLRAIAQDAARSGYQQLALQVRHHKFPYELREYRIGLRGRGKRIDVRGVDTIQILARALDALHHGGHDSPRL